MGLAERKVKQRIGHDPRNLTWSGDTSRFSYKHMTSLGWKDSQGLGSSQDGNPNHIAVVRKLDNGGIGMARAKKDGDDNAAGAGQAGRGLEDVLKRLAAASASASPSPAPESPAAGDSDKEKEIKKRNKIASRQRHLQSKRLASSSPAALAEILGVPVSSLPASPSPSVAPTPEPSTPATPAEPTPAEASTQSEPKRTAEETVTTSTLSVSDYFRLKMREKMAQRQAAAAAKGEVAAEMPADSLANVKEPGAKKVIGGAQWEGSKVEFEEVPVEIGNLGGDIAGPSQTADSMPQEDEKAAKKARKEAKRLKKLAEESKSDESDSVEAKKKKDKKRKREDGEAEDKAKEKREKKERKEKEKEKRDKGETKEKKRKSK